MSKDNRTRKGAGRLSRRDQGKLGDMLKQVYEDIVREGVPDRFKKLLNEFETTENDATAIERVNEPQNPPVEVLRPDPSVPVPTVQDRGSSE